MFNIDSYTIRETPLPISINKITVIITNMIENYKIQIILSVLGLLFVILINSLFHKISKKSKRISHIKDTRKVMIQKTVTLILTLVFIIILVFIWRINKQDIFIAMSSVVGIVGIGFFAQWSLLSNITSGLILYTSHPITIGGNIKIVDKDNPVEGKIIDIGLFFVQIELPGNRQVSIPNNILLQKPFIFDTKK
jgi:small-conductance mechanosensitive channel